MYVISQVYVIYFAVMLLFPLQMFIYQRWSRGHKARGQGQGHKKNPRPRTRTAFPRTDTLEAKDRNARDQGHKRKCSQKKRKKILTKIFLVISKKKKVFTKIFQAISTKKRFPKNFSSAPQNFNNSIAFSVLELRNTHQTRETKALKYNMRGTSLSLLSIDKITYFELASHSFCDVNLCNCVISHVARKRENKRNKALCRYRASA